VSKIQKDLKQNEGGMKNKRATGIPVALHENG
jgi:hypothetical protein